MSSNARIITFSSTFGSAARAITFSSTFGSDTRIITFSSTLGFGGGSDGSVRVTLALKLVETFPAASLAQAYRVLVPSVANVKFEGANVRQFGSEGEGVKGDSVTI